MERPKGQIEEIVNRETRAWDTQDVNLLMTLFHPDMVWVWPRTAEAHDPLDWLMELGKFDRQRWSDAYTALFASHRLVHNKRKIIKIVVSDEGDGAFAVVDVDTLWSDQAGNDFHWYGRACKIYTKVADEWKMISHTGLLTYPGMPGSGAARG